MVARRALQKSTAAARPAELERNNLGISRSYACSTALGGFTRSRRRATRTLLLVLIAVLQAGAVRRLAE